MDKYYVTFKNLKIQQISNSFTYDIHRTLRCKFQNEIPCNDMKFNYFILSLFLKTDWKLKKRDQADQTGKGQNI